MKPIVLAMILCDSYYRDKHSGKSILAGTFSSIEAPSFPTKHGNCAIYIALTDVAKKEKLRLSFRSTEDDFTIDIPRWDIEPPKNRKAVIEIGGNINGLPLPAAGEYEFVVFWNDEEIASRRLTARFKEKNDDEGDLIK